LKLIDDFYKNNTNINEENPKNIDVSFTIKNDILIVKDDDKNTTCKKT
jgi:hypothetical protein